MALEGWEDETHSLTEYELKILLPVIIRGLKTKIGSGSAITQIEAVKKLKNKGYKISGARWRKIINYIRRKDLISNLLASSTGYYIATDLEDCRRFVESLYGRENAIRAVRIAMQKQIGDRFNYRLDFPEE